MPERDILQSKTQRNTRKIIPKLSIAHLYQLHILLATANRHFGLQKLIESLKRNIIKNILTLHCENLMIFSPLEMFFYLYYILEYTNSHFKKN